MVFKWWPLLVALPGQAVANGAAETELQPLSEEFLLFLADMDEVEGQLVHPVDFEMAELSQSQAVKVTSEETAKATSMKDENN